MNIVEIEAALRACQNELKLLQARIDHLEALKDQSARHSEETFEARKKSDYQAILAEHLRQSQFLALSEMLFALVERTGFSEEQMGADYNRLWRKLLDESLQKLEDKNPNLAAHADERTEEQQPLE